MSHLVAIVGRPNVGKSTLFNRLTQTRGAIVSEEAGTTRDRQYGKVSWLDREFSIVDTGGWVVGSEDIFEGEINKQVEIAMEEADVILFVVDVESGITDLDDEVAAKLRRTKKPVLLVANKADNFAQHYEAAEFYSFGLGDAALDVDDEEDDIGFLHGDLYLLVDLAFEDIFATYYPTAGVDDGELAVEP